MTTHPVRVSYIWCSGRDTHHDIRGKDRTVLFTADQLALPHDEVIAQKVIPDWNFDGSSTAQARGLDTEIIVKPVRAFPNPLPTDFPNQPRMIILCECFTPDGKPTEDNTRYLARQVFARDQKDLKPWFGMEQEYVLLENDRPVGWPATGFPAPQGPYYCGNGPFAYGRRLVDKHYDTCLAMGLKISGINAEVMPGQWEFQVGPCEGIEMGDHLLMARWLFLRLLEQATEETNGRTLFDIDFNAKPVKGDWNGNGLHTNFSTTETRADGGMKSIHECLGRLAKTVKKEIVFYGHDNLDRLTGMHETSKYSEFTFGVGTRNTSVRIPNPVQADGKGYFEDRRPGGNADPYLISSRLFSSACDVSAPELDELAERIQHSWMNF